MKRKHATLWICGMALMSSLWFMACPTGTDPEPEETAYSVITETYLRSTSDPDELKTDGSVGTITSTPGSGPTGTDVTVIIKSGPAYYLDQVWVDSKDEGKNNPLTFKLLDKDVTVKAYFKAIPDNNFKVTLEQPEGGTISIMSIAGVNGQEYGPSGSTVTLSNKPAEGYSFIRYTVDGEAITGNTFTLPAKNVTVSGVFEKLADKTLEQLINTGKDALKSGEVTVALNAFETAYAKDAGNAEALVYSTIGKLASVAWSNEVGSFFKNHLGLTYYPNTLDALIHPESWFAYNPSKDRADRYYDSTLGETLVWESKSNYTWEGGAAYFDKYYTEGDGYYYQGPYKFVSAEPQYDTDGNKILSYKDDAGNWIGWVEREDSWRSDAEFKKYYPDGNGYYSWDFLYIFVDKEARYDYTYQPPLSVPDWITEQGAYKDTLVTIGDKSVISSASWSIILIANLIDKHSTGLNSALDAGITAIFDNPNYTEGVRRTAQLKGKEPVQLDGDIIENFGLSGFFGADDLYIGWAELELLLSALKLVKATLLYVDSYNWTYDIGFVKDLPWDESVLNDADIDTIAAKLNQILPLRTGFMSARSGPYLEDSRKAYGEALTSIIGVYDYYISDSSKLPSGYKETLESYKSYREDAEKAKDAIDQKKSITVNIPGTGELTINFDKFFTSGQLALEGLIETEGSGNVKAPVFYDLTGSTPKQINAAEDFTNFCGIKIKPDKIGDIIGTDFAKSALPEYLLLDGTSAVIAWAVYHWDEAGKDLKEFLIGYGTP
ncbi:MAG: hypothetical protein LBU25_09400 [Treponema sp.]|nr:hypothetical protein [Treponema sp.]